MSNTSGLAAMLSIALQENYLKAKMENSSRHISFEEQKSVTETKAWLQGNAKVTKTLEI